VTALAAAAVAGAPIALPFVPRVHQAAAHTARRVTRWLVLVWHRRAGKTVFAVMELVLAALHANRGDERYGYICPLLKQAKEVAWEYLKRFTRPIPGVRANETELSIAFPNGAVIRLYGADHPDSLRGSYFDGVVLDEVGQMKRFLWGEIVRPMLADRQGWSIFIGTPKGVNLFSEVYFAAINDREWYADRKTAYETDAIEPAEIEAAKRAMSPQAFAQEFLCDFFAAVENVLIPLEVVQAAERRDLKPDAYRWAPRIVGVDVARFGDDQSAIARRQGRVAFKIERHHGLSTMSLAGRVAAVATEWGADAIFIDVTGGLGAGPLDRLRELGYPAIAVDFGAAADNPRCKNKRTEMWVAMAEWSKDGCLPVDPMLEQELPAATYDYDSSARLYLAPKEDIKEKIGRSPDGGDGLSTTFAAPVAPREPGLPKAFGRATQATDRVVIDYDPYGERS
jgi:hypothetical protein